MNALQQFDAVLTRREKNLLNRLRTPADIQSFLDGIPYKVSTAYQSPLGVLRTRQANCFDGALFAAAVLRRCGQNPSIVHLCAEDDDDHIIALYRHGRHLGAIAKSNFVGLRFREAVYRNLRELVMSYFEAYFNLKRKKSLRAYTNPLCLRSFDRLYWMTDDKAVEAISERLDRLARHRLINASMIKNLSPVDGRTFRAHLIGATLKRAADGEISPAND